MMVLFIKTDAPADTMAAAVRKEVFELDPDQPVHNIRTVESRLADRLVPHRLLLTLISIFGALALLLATGGIYSVMAYMVSQRAHEFGIRMAIGAQARDMLGLVLSKGMRLAVIGVGVGLFSAFTVTPFLTKQLFGVSARDPWTFAAIPILLLALAVAASLVPARRATRVAPIVALRHE
jgi:ABC-type antimicrobial peptide transport system permease subunit